MGPPRYGHLGFIVALAGPLAAPGVWGEKRAAGSIRALNAPPRLDSAAFVPYWGARAPERVRAISTARLCTSPCLHLRPIDVIVSDGPRMEILSWGGLRA